MKHAFRNAVWARRVADVVSEKDKPSIIVDCLIEITINLGIAYRRFAKSDAPNELGVDRPAVDAAFDASARSDKLREPELSGKARQTIGIGEIFSEHARIDGPQHLAIARDIRGKFGVAMQSDGKMRVAVQPDFVPSVVEFANALGVDHGPVRRAAAQQRGGNVKR